VAELDGCPHLAALDQIGMGLKDGVHLFGVGYKEYCSHADIQHVERLQEERNYRLMHANLPHACERTIGSGVPAEHALSNLCEGGSCEVLRNTARRGFAGLLRQRMVVMTRLSRVAARRPIRAIVSLEHVRKDCQIGGGLIQRMLGSSSRVVPSTM
jgi:hypothetical protein